MAMSARAGRLYVCRLRAAVLRTVVGPARPRVNSEYRVRLFIACTYFHALRGACNLCFGNDQCSIDAVSSDAARSQVGIKVG